MLVHGFIGLALLLLQNSAASALPSLNKRISPLHDVQNIQSTRVANATSSSILTKNLTAYHGFPPGPPTDNYFDSILGSDLGVVYHPFGHNPRQDQQVVLRILFEATGEALGHRVYGKVPRVGLQSNIQNTIFGVKPSVGDTSLTWGMWTRVLVSLSSSDGYIHTYPGYDFSFDIALLKDESSDYDVIASGFLMALVRGEGGGSDIFL